MDVLSIFWNAFLQQPFWLQAGFVVAVILRIGWPDFFAE